MLNDLATDIGLWRSAALILGLLAFGGWGIALGGTANMIDGAGRKIGFPLGGFRYWRYIGTIFSGDFYARQKPSQRWFVHLARFAFWMQFAWLAAMVRLAQIDGLAG